MDSGEWVAQQRLSWGKEHVDDCLRRATVDKLPGYFYAVERGRVVGTPFPADHPVAEWQAYALVMGTTFAVFMKQPVRADVQTPVPGATA